MPTPCTHMHTHAYTHTFVLNSSFTRSQRCSIWLWTEAWQNKGGILEEAMCQTLVHEVSQGFKTLDTAFLPCRSRDLLFFLSFHNIGCASFFFFFSYCAVEWWQWGKLSGVWSVQRYLAMSAVCDVCGWCVCLFNWGPLFSCWIASC